MFKKKFFIKLGLEIIAIIIGITASFGISEISVKRNNENQKKRVLNSINIESDEIKKYCKERLKIWNQDIEIYNILLSEKVDVNKLKKIAISKNRVEYSLIYFRDFNPPMNRYKTFVNTGDLKFIKSENIMESLTRLHNLNYNKVLSTVEYEKKIIDLNLKVITEKNPKIFLNGNNSNVSFDKYIIELQEFINKNESFKSNLIIQLKYFKTRVSSLKFYMLTIDDLQYNLKN